MNAVLKNVLSEPTTEVMTVTPVMAERWLKTMVTNRDVSDSKVWDYAFAIDEGRWSLNMEAIKFDDEGRLFDGQHRLLACVRAAKPFRTAVSHGVSDPRAMATVDTGKARSHTDVWNISGHKNAAVISTIAMMVFMHQNNRVSWSGFTGRRISRSSSQLAQQMKRAPTQSSNVSKEELLEFGESIIVPLSESAKFITSNRARKVVSPQAAGALHYFATKKGHRAEVEAFLTEVGEGTGLQKGDPAHTIREHIASRTRSGAKLHRVYVFGLLIKAWNRRLDGSKVSVLRVQDGEPFPKIN